MGISTINHDSFTIVSQDYQRILPQPMKHSSSSHDKNAITHGHFHDESMIAGHHEF